MRLGARRQQIFVVPALIQAVQPTEPPEVREYAVTLAAEAAVRPGADGTELESCGWYGLPHLHAHDKTGGVPLDGPAQYLMSLCFCYVCTAGYAGLGVEADDLRLAVRAALAPVWAGTWKPGGEGEWELVPLPQAVKDDAAVKPPK